MKKLTAGVVTGLVLGAVQGVVTEAPDADAFGMFLGALGRGSQGVINGILVAYMTRPMTPLWRGGLTGAMVGAVLAVVAMVAGNPAQPWVIAVPSSAVVGAGCGIAAAKVAR